MHWDSWFGSRLSTLDSQLQLHLQSRSESADRNSHTNRPHVCLEPKYRSCIFTLVALEQLAASSLSISSVIGIIKHSQECAQRVYIHLVKHYLPMLWIA